MVMKDSNTLSLSLHDLEIVETGVIHDTCVNTMAADALATQEASAAVVLTVQDKGVLVFQEDGFQPPAPFQCQQNDRICTVKSLI